MTLLLFRVILEKHGKKILLLFLLILATLILYWNTATHPSVGFSLLIILLFIVAGILVGALIIQRNLNKILSGGKELLNSQPLSGLAQYSFETVGEVKLTGRVNGFYTTIFPLRTLHDESSAAISMYTEKAPVAKEEFEISGVQFSFVEEESYVLIVGLISDFEKTYTAEQLHFFLTRVTDQLTELNLVPKANMVDEPMD